MNRTDTTGPLEQARIQALINAGHSLGALNLRLEISQNWAATAPGFRDNLRSALKEATACETVLDNKNVFRWKDGYFSLSHSEKAGGFAIASNPIGLDIETKTRELSEKAYLRISNEEERSLGMRPIELWVAKEAAFKALNSLFQSEKTASPDFRPKTITQIIITEKAPLKSSSIYRFSFKLKDFKWLANSGVGLIDSQNETCLGIAIILP